MKKIFILINILLCFPIVVNALNISTKTSMIEGSETDTYNNVVNTRDGGYIVVGYSESPEFTNKEEDKRMAFIVKYKDAEIQWTSTYGLEDNNHFSYVEELFDGTYLATGQYNFNKAVLVRYDQDGKILYEQHSGESECQYEDIIPTTDGGYLIHETRGWNETKTKSLIVKYNKNNVKEWEKEIELGTYIYKIKKYNNEEFFAIYQNFINGTGEYYLARININGEIKEQTKIDTTLSNIADFEISKEGQIFITGFSYENYYEYYAGVEYISKNDGIVWSKKIKGNKNVFASSLVILNDGGILVVGQTNSTEIEGMQMNDTSTKTFFLKYDIEGNEHWKNFYSETIPSKVIVGNNNNFIAVGNRTIIKKEGTLTSVLMDAKLIDTTYEYDFKIDKTDNGKVQVNQKGELGKITVEPNEGYELNDLVIEDENGQKFLYYMDNEEMYIKLFDNATIKASFKQSPTNPNTSINSYIITFLITCIIICVITLIVKHKKVQQYTT